MFRLFCLLFVSSFPLVAQVIPRPMAEKPVSGNLRLGPEVKVAFPEGTEALFAPMFRDAGLQATTAKAVDAVVKFQSPAANDKIPRGEGYRLRITPEGVTITAATPAGRLYGWQSFVQIAEAAEKSDGAALLTCREIADKPRFEWRGYMLDESRHFTGEAGVKRLLDAMSRYKLNRFHWHLTDSPGWRIEIKRYPELTRTGGRGNESDLRPDAPAQFYTQDQVRDIVAYAKQRGIIVIPEIDMPGHADAAVKAYPEHDGGGFLQKGRTDKWPRFTFNPAKKDTLEFLDHILEEVAALFPDAGVIHFGGDEVHFGWHKWPELPEVKDLMKREGLKDLAGVETWFNRRMAGKINSLGFKTGGWDEIAARELPADQTVVWWWRHDKPQVLRQALDASYPVILCPRRPCYFDFVQHESHQTGRRWGGFNPLADVYQFPKSLDLSPSDEEQVLGIQACLWTETAVTQARRDFLTWPRLVALAEAAWTPENRKDFASFETRLKPQLAWLDRHGIGFYDPFANSSEISDKGAKPEYPDKPE